MRKSNDDAAAGEAAARPLLTRAPGVGASALLAATLLAVNALAVWGIVAGRRTAEEAAAKELELQTTAHARSLEALLATLRGDFLFLAQSPPLRHYPAALDSGDPMVRRWGRLDAEGTLLLFLEANPPVEKVVVRDAAGSVQMVAGRRAGAPLLLPPEEAGAPAGDGLWQGRWTLGAADEAVGSLDSWIDSRDLLAIAAPGLEESLRLETGEDEGVDTARGELVARVAVLDDGWEPPIAWRLVRRADESRLLSSVEALAGRYRTTVYINLAVVSLTLLLGAVAFRQVRRAARLEAENEQQARVRELERQLLHSERLASVGRLAAGLAHEINNPLEGMSNYLRLLEEDLAAGRLVGAPRLLARLKEGLARVAGILHQVLAFSDPGRAPKEAVDVGAALRETVDFVRASSSLELRDVRLELSGDLVVHGNPVTLGQLFLNLLLNACEGQPQGAEVAIDGTREGDTVAVRVRDRGPGFADDALAHLFEPFYSTRGSTGLGLAVCRGIVLDHGGAIEARNRDGGGAEVEVRLPAAGGRVTPEERGAQGGDAR